MLLLFLSCRQSASSAAAWHPGRPRPVLQLHFFGFAANCLMLLLIMLLCFRVLHGNTTTAALVFAGSRPPAQLHGTLDGSGSGGVDAEEEQEIQKIISEIHGTGKPRSRLVHLNDSVCWWGHVAAQLGCLYRQYVQNLSCVVVFCEVTAE
jgi:hypothetical protein